MARTIPKTNWAQSSVPTADDFNYIENKLVGLEQEKEPKFEKKSAFNKDFGSNSGTVCQGNDDRLSDARPASDVSAWAKESEPPAATQLTGDGTSGQILKSNGYSAPEWVSQSSLTVGKASTADYATTVSKVSNALKLKRKYQMNSSFLEGTVSFDGSGMLDLSNELNAKYVDGFRVKCYSTTSGMSADTSQTVYASDFGLNYICGMIAVSRKTSSSGYPGVLVLSQNGSAWTVICDRDSNQGFYAIAIGY